MFKFRQMGHYVMVSFLCESLLNNTKFRFLYFSKNNCKAHLTLNQEKEFPNDSGRPLSKIILPIKSSADKKQCFLRFLN